MPTDPSGLLGNEAISIPEVHKPPPGLRSPVAGPVIFEILVATMWSVGELVADEVERTRAVAIAMELRELRGGSAFGTIAAGALVFPEIDFELLDPREARLAYAAAEWISATSVPSERRDGFLRALRLRLRLEEDEAAILQDLARSVDAIADSVQAAYGLLANKL